MRWGNFDSFGGGRHGAHGPARDRGIVTDQESDPTSSSNSSALLTEVVFYFGKRLTVRGLSTAQETRPCLGHGRLGMRHEA
jgi:hypothetical protein